MLHLFLTIMNEMTNLKEDTQKIYDEIADDEFRLDRL